MMPVDKIEIGQTWVDKNYRLIASKTYTLNKIVGTTVYAIQHSLPQSKDQIFGYLTQTNPQSMDLSTYWERVIYKEFHAHIYQNAHEKNIYGQIRYSISQFVEEARFEASTIKMWGVKIGELYDSPIGPHPLPMFQIKFDERDFSSILNFLSKNRRGQSVLIHPVTGNELLDHQKHAIWMGKPINLNFNALR
jgi:DOPA 4,5-dioxygenase